MSYGKSIDFLFNQMRNGSIGSLAGGNINFYYAGTTTRKPVYLDRDMTQSVTTAYTLSADGTAELYGDGLYRIIVKSSTGVTIYDYDDVSFVDLSSQLDTTLISDRDLFYQMTLNGVQFKQCHRDVFDAADTVVLGGSPLATYSALDFSYYGQSGSTITTPNVITSGTYSRAWLYVQADTAAAVTHEYSTDAGVTWSAVAVDGYISASFSSLLIRTTWGGPGKIYSYGLFYDYYGAYTVIPAGIYSSVTFDTLADAITQIGTASATLRIENGISVGGGAAQTIPSNIVVVVDKVGSINLDQNLTINGSFSAGLCQVFTGSGTVTFGSGAVSEVYPEWWGAIADGVTDCSSAIQYCIRSINAPIRLSAGVYKINSCINGSELGTKQVVIRGAGNNYTAGVDKSGTTILGNTNGWMLDLCGSTFISIEDVKLLSDSTVGTPSKGGILNARTALHGYVMYHYMKNVHIFIKSNPAFTSVGSIAIYADNQENQTYELCWFEADTPFVATMNNELSVSSPYTTIVSSPMTNTDITHRQVVYKGITGAGIILYGKGSSTFDQIFVQPHDGTNTYPHGIVLRNSTGAWQCNHALHFTGQVEDYDYALIAEGDTYNLNFDMTLAGSVDLGIVRLTGGTNHYNPKINATWYAHTGVAKKLVLSTNTTPANIYGGEIFVTTDLTLSDQYTKYIGTRITFAGGGDTRSGALFNPASGSTYDITSTTTPLIGTGSWTAGAITTKSYSAGGFAVTGAALGDIVDVSLNIDLQSCILYGYVQTADTVVLGIFNPTGDTVTFGSATYKIAVRQP